MTVDEAADDLDRYYRAVSRARELAEARRAVRELRTAAAVQSSSSASSTDVHVASAAADDSQQSWPRSGRECVTCSRISNPRRT